MLKAVQELPIVGKFDGQIAQMTRHRDSRTDSYKIYLTWLYGFFRIEFGKQLLAKLDVPTSTDERIDAICSRIRELCRGPLSPEDEAEIRRLAVELRSVINEHVRLAKSSLRTKQSAITARDPEAA